MQFQWCLSHRRRARKMGNRRRHSRVARHRARRSVQVWRSPALALALITALVFPLATVAPVSAAGSLIGPTWNASSNVIGAPATYSYRFTAADSAALTEVTATVPPGTTAPNGLTVLNASAFTGDPKSFDYLKNPAASLDAQSNLLTVTFTSSQHSLASGYVVSLDIAGLVNAPTPGEYTSVLTTFASRTSIDMGTTPAVSLTAASLSGTSWSATSTVTSAADVSYTYTLRTPVAAEITAVTMTVPPGATANSVDVGAVTPASIAGGTVDLRDGILTYALPGSGVPVSDSSTVTITVTGFTNTGTVASFASQIVAYTSGGNAVGAATTAPITFAQQALTSPSWESTSTSAGSPTTYTWNFTTPGAGLSTITMTVPPGTTGNPALGPITVHHSYGDETLTDPTVTLVGTTLVFAFAYQYVNAAAFSVSITGLTTSQTAGTYASTITALNGGSGSTVPSPGSGNPVASTGTNTLSLSDTTLGTPLWNVSSTVPDATNVTYDYSFTVSVDAPVATVTMTVPTGTGGAPAIVPSGTSGLPADGTVSFSADGTKVFYTFSPVTIPAGTHVTLEIDGLTNTSTTGTYSSALTVEDAGTAVLASAVTTPISFSSAELTDLSWSQSSQATNAADVTYTYGFTTAHADTDLDEMTMTVPLGTTTGTSLNATITDIPPYEHSGQATDLTASVSLVRSTLVLSSLRDPNGGTPYIRKGTVFTVTVTGMTNTSIPASYSSAITTMLRGNLIDSGTTPAVTFVGGPLVAASWSVDQTTAGSDRVADTFAFTTASTSPLSEITVKLPAGTGGAGVAVGTVAPAIAAGGSVSLAATTLTYTFTPTSIAAGTRLSVEVTGLTNPMAPGAYPVTITTSNGTTPIDHGMTNAVTILAQSLAFTNECATPLVACAATGTGSTGLTLLAVPGGAETFASVTLTVTTNAAHGYVVKAQMSPLTDPGGRSIAQAPASGGADPGVDRYFATATLKSAAGSGAALCMPYAGPTADVGYAPAPGASLWFAAAGSGTDTITLRNAVAVSAIQPAGEYTGTIRYTIEPHYTGSAVC